jgi:integrase
MWLEAQEGAVGEKHHKGVRTFARLHLYGLADMRIDQIRTEHVVSARKRYLKRHSKESANLWLRNLRLLFNWAAAKGRKLIAEVPWEVSEIRTQKKPRALLPQLRTAEWLQAVDRIAGKRWGLAVAIRLMLGLGLREDEALSARWEWISWELGTYTPGKTKGKEADPLHVPAWLLDYLKRRRKTRGLIAPSPRDRRRPYSPGATRGVILKANEIVGTPGVSPHRLRGTYATWLSVQGVPVQDIQEALRHKDPSTTMKYLEKDRSRVAEAQEKIAQAIGLTWTKSGQPERSGAHGAWEKDYS